MTYESRSTEGITIEWPTVLLIILCYGIWAGLLVFKNETPVFMWILFSALNITLFMSITHEVVHFHPTRNRLINQLMIALPIGWSIPFERFRDTHLDHHNTGELTDPFDDPESWYLANYDWIGREPITRAVLTFNNTLLGRMVIGPAIGLGRFFAGEFASILRGGKQGRYVLRVWLQHFALCSVLAFIIVQTYSAPIWHWVMAIYLGHSFLYVRTFLEHQATPEHGERTVIIEKACPIAFLFLFNNYHFVHHDKPGIAWYRLPSEYRNQKQQYVERNGAYVYSSYGEVFRRFFLRAKEPVSHPFLHTNV